MYSRGGVGYFTPQLRVGQARERFPQYAYEYIGSGLVAHAIISWLETPNSVLALCNETGLASDRVDDFSMVCLKCLKRAKDQA